MDAIKVSNTRPGFVPFSVTPLRIAGQIHRRQPQAFKPAPYRPPMLSNPARLQMGQGGFVWSEIPSSIGIIAGGAAGIALSSVMPSPLKEILVAGGIGIIGLGVVNLFGGPVEQKSPERPTGGDQVPQKTPSMEAFEMAKGSIISPSEGSEPALNVWTWTTNYNATIIWYNPSEDQVNFAYDIFVDVRVPGLPSAQVTSGRSVYSGSISLKPGQDTGPLRVAIPVVRPSRDFESFGYDPKFWNELTLRKYDPAGKAIPVFGPVRVGPFPY